LTEARPPASAPVSADAAPGTAPRTLHPPAGDPSARDHYLSIGLFFLSLCLFTAENVATRMIGLGLPTEQITFVRALGGMALTLPICLWVGPSVLRVTRFRLHLLRGLLSFAGLWLYFYCFAVLPLAIATTITFSKAFFLAILAAFFLKEVVGRRRWAAIAIGSAGVLIVMRPGADGFEWAALAALASAALSGAVLVCTKIISRNDSPLSIMFYLSLITVGFSLVPGLLSWRTPGASDLFWLSCIAILGPSAQYAGILAFRAGSVATLAPIDYARIILTLAAGFLFFGEFPDVISLVGTCVIVGAALLTTLRRSD